VRRLLFEGKRAVGVEAESGGQRFTVEGDQIVLSAGTLASPHLLLLSGVGSAAQLRPLGIEVIHDLPGVGQNLRDHPFAMIAFRETGTVPDYLRQPSCPAILRYTAEGSTMQNDMQIGPISLDSAFLGGMPVTQGEPCFGLYAAIHGGAVSRGELTLTSRDPHVQPAIDYHYLSDPWDRKRMREAIRLVLRLAEHPALQARITAQISITAQDLASDAALDAWLLRNVGAGYHCAGTCKMGPASDPMAVVDQYGWVHGLEGLRVVDASVMPDVVRANTNATTMMIAERVADWMKAGR
jgi:choline dehydrogenase